MVQSLALQFHAEVSLGKTLAPDAVNVCECLSDELVRQPRFYRENAIQSLLPKTGKKAGKKKIVDAIIR